MERHHSIGLGVVILVIVGIITAILACSFANLEYYQYGFKRRRSTGAVDTDNVYSGGRHLVGPDMEFKPFKADMHFEELPRMSVFTADKLEVWLTISYQYFLRKHDLHELHGEFDIHYAPILKKNAQDALKGAATVFTTWEFIKQRRIVEDVLFKALKERLGGNCCEKDCTKTKNCVKGCKAYSTCTREEKGLFADVRYFQLQGVHITDYVKDRHLKALTVQEETAKAQFYQEAIVVQKQTDAMVRDIHNQAAEISQNAAAHSTMLITVAKANATAITEQARSDGLHSLYRRLGITSKDHKASFDYLRTLKDMDSAYLSVDFSQLIVGPVNPNVNGGS